MTFIISLNKKRRGWKRIYNVMQRSLHIHISSFIFCWSFSIFAWPVSPIGKSFNHSCYFHCLTCEAFTRKIDTWFGDRLLLLVKTHTANVTLWEDNILSHPPPFHCNHNWPKSPDPSWACLEASEVKLGVAFWNLPHCWGSDSQEERSWESETVTGSFSAADPMHMKLAVNS